MSPLGTRQIVRTRQNELIAAAHRSHRAAAVRRQRRTPAFTTLGAFAVRRRRWLLGFWAVFLVVGFVVGGQLFTRLDETGGSSSSESFRGYELLDEASDDSATVLVLVDRVAADAIETERTVEAAVAAVERLPFVRGVHAPYRPGGEMLVARDGDAVAMSITVSESDELAEVSEQQDAVRDAVSRAVERELPDARVSLGGSGAVMVDQMHTTQSDLVKGELVAMPILLIALVLVFRGFRAALLPLASAFVTMAGALLLLLGASTFTSVASYAVDVVALFGLALAVDYSLLMVNRFREERAAGASVEAAVERSVRAAGRTVAFSAMTVVASLAGLLVFDNAVFRSLAIGGIATVAVAMAAGLTLMPALLAVMGRKIKVADVHVRDEGRFSRTARWVQKRPLAVVVAVTGVLVVSGLPFLGATYSNGDYRVLPVGTESRDVADALTDRFPGGQATAPVSVVAEAAPDSPAVAAYAERVRAMAGVESVAVTGDPARGLAVVEAVPAGTSQGDVAQQLVADLRADRPAFPTHVTGEAAFLVDFQDSLVDRLPYALGLIAVATFVLLFLMTGSVLVPLKALVMNTLSLTATFGALVWVFQDGHLSGLLGFDAFGAIEVWVPLIVFVFAFGLSMDYEVFLLSRIKEAYDRCGDSDRAVAIGLQRSGRIITSAALLVMIVFLGFATGSNLGIKEMGLALAIAVVVDATLVRTLLVPATMALLGEANWWAPQWMRRVHHRFGLREEPEPAEIVDVAPGADVDVDVNVGEGVLARA